MAFIEGMENRTLSIYSASKMFSMTGIRIGWAIGCENIIKELKILHQYGVYCQYEPLQDAMAQSLDIISDNNYMQ